jgi:hypothetical protein
MKIKGIKGIEGRWMMLMAIYQENIWILFLSINLEFLGKRSCMENNIILWFVFKMIRKILTIQVEAWKKIICKQTENKKQQKKKNNLKIIK